MMVIIVLCLVALIAGSVFGIFFSGEDYGTGMSMQTVVQEINQEYDERLEQEKNSVSYDVLEMSGSRAVWKEVLAVYSVKVNTDPDNPMEVAILIGSARCLRSNSFSHHNARQADELRPIAPAGVPMRKRQEKMSPAACLYEV